MGLRCLGRFLLWNDGILLRAVELDCEHWLDDNEPSALGDTAGRTSICIMAYDTSYV